ncbi:hypothetical protein GF312_00700 [Candidatus Poribacteria bacterium]|nr:hypothetical protein [Candidatus Poribacteria bacterium]
MSSLPKIRITRVKDKPLLDLSAVPWANRRKTIMVPTVLDMSRYTIESLDRFYMYYAPHHSKGIGLATSPHPEGPWTPYKENPIITLDQFPGIKGHISALEMTCLKDKGIFLCYPHGSGLKSGQDTVIGSSKDGITFEAISDAPILSSDPSCKWEQRGASYLRVFEYKDTIYGIFKSEKMHGLVKSKDGIHWEYWPRNPLIEPLAEEKEYDRIRHTSVIIVDDVLFMFYSTYTKSDLSCESIKLATCTLTDNWKNWGKLKRWKEVFTPELDWEENNVRDPFLLKYGDIVYMYYVGGNEKGIALAKTDYRLLEEYANIINTELQEE